MRRPHSGTGAGIDRSIDAGISVVLPTLNEASTIGPLVSLLRTLVDDVVVSDGESADGTAGIADRAGARVIVGSPGRGVQLDRGAQLARCGRLWFLHADTVVRAASVRALRAAKGPWGCFDTKVQSDDPRLRCVGPYMTMRARRTGACSGDMGIWADLPFFVAAGGFGPLPAFEDLAFSDRARSLHPCEVLTPALLTSARRWTTEGVTLTLLRGWKLRLGYRVGVDPIRLSARYHTQPR